MENLTRKYIIWYAIALHYVWAALLFVDVTPLHTAPLSSLQLLSQSVACAVLFGSSTLATLGLFKRARHQWIQLLELLPQQILMTVSAVGAIQLIIAQQYADGVPRPWAFMAADQASVILAAVFHTVALLESFGPIWILHPGPLSRRS